MPHDLQSKLEAITAAEDETEMRQYAFVKEVEQYSEGLTLIEPVLLLFERHPDFDFGYPGPLVHFIERYYRNGYEEELEKSLARRPTALTVWLLNRIINGSDGEIKLFWISLLETLATSETTEINARAHAMDFLTLHQ